MEYRPLGQTGLDVSAIGFGCSRIAAGDRREADATLSVAVERGITIFDTANAYDDDERMLGRALRPHRDRLVVCSKAGYRHWLQLELERWMPMPTRTVRRQRAAAGSHGRPPVKPRRNFSARALRLGVEGSLRRLRTDYLDVFYLHGPPSDVLTDAAVVAALEGLRQAGRVRCLGISFGERASTDTVIADLGACPWVAAVQVMAGPLGGVDLDRLVPVTTARGIGIVARQLFHRGAIFNAAEAAVPVAAGHTLAPTVIRNILQRREVSTALVGMRSRRHLDENLQAVATRP